MYVQAARLAAAARPRLPEPRRNRDEHGADVAVDDLELAPLADRPLVRVAREDQLGARVDERAENAVALSDGLLPRPPGRADHVVVERDDAERAGRRLPQALGRPAQLAAPQAAGLLPPRAHGVQPDHVVRRGRMDRLGLGPFPFELGERPRKALGGHARDVMVPGDDEERRAEPAQEGRGLLVLRAAVAVGHVARHDHQLGLQPLDESGEGGCQSGVLHGAGVEVRHMQESRCHGRSRLYSPVNEATMSDEATEIFDDLYLGLRAGGALRKQRRGESLTTEEIEALTRWQRLSPWRKAVAIGAFGVGTFGLGFTLGGLIFGRWRKA
jgi:hypothetical protein